MDSLLPATTGKPSGQSKRGGHTARDFSSVPPVISTPSTRFYVSTLSPTPANGTALASQAQLSKAMFPIGTLPKSTVRELATRWQLSNMDRPDSQGICFLGKVKFSEFVKAHLGERPGPMIEVETGEVHCRPPRTLRGSVLSYGAEAGQYGVDGIAPALFPVLTLEPPSSRTPVASTSRLAAVSRAAS
jgi:hypothetical protein